MSSDPTRQNSYSAAVTTSNQRIGAHTSRKHCFEHVLYILPRTNALACQDLALDSTQRMFDPVFMLVLSPALSRNLKNRQVDHIKELHNIVTMTVCGLYYSEFWIWNFVFRHIYANCG